MTEELFRTIAWCVVALFAIQGATVYAVVRFLTTGRSIFERRPHARVTEFER